LGNRQTAIELVQTHNILLDDDLAEQLTPEVGAIKNEDRNAVLLLLGKVAKKQQN